MIYVYTSSAWNYLPKAQLLAHSVKKYIPQATMILGLSDRLTEGVDYKKYGFDEIIPMTEKLCPVPNYTGWVFSHPIVELSTAIKPFILCELLERPDCEAVLYFDPDMVLFSPMDDMLKEFENNSILLTPHVTIPEKNYQSIIDNELGALKWGVYNFGYYGIKNSPEGKRYAAWWRDRVAEWCYDDIPNGIFTDQKWNDITPALFDEVKILKSPRFNVATWNTTQREFAGSLEEGFTVNGEPLGFYHFTGFDSGNHRIMMQRAKNPAVQEKLVEWYEKKLDEVKSDPLCQLPWAFMNYSDGTKIPLKHRNYFRKDRGVMEFFKDPFDVTTTENNYRNWYSRNIELTAADVDFSKENCLIRLTHIQEECKALQNGRLSLLCDLDAANNQLKEKEEQVQNLSGEVAVLKEQYAKLQQQLSEEIKISKEQCAKLQQELSIIYGMKSWKLSRFISKCLHPDRWF